MSVLDFVLDRFGSEMAWDSTGQEGVYAWSAYFNDTDTATNAVNSILAYQPTIPHCGYNGNARRYWYAILLSACSFVALIAIQGQHIWRKATENREANSPLW